MKVRKEVDDLWNHIFYLYLANIGGRPPVVAVDFDGTLTADNNFPNCGKQNKLMCDLVRYMHHKGVYIILNTCRTGKYLDNALLWCKNRKVHIDIANKQSPFMRWADEIKPNEVNKVWADLYIDDKAFNLLQYKSKE